MRAEGRSRRLIRIGGSVGLTVPKDFLERNNLTIGDRVGLITNDIILLAVPRVPKEREHGDDITGRKDS